MTVVIDLMNMTLHARATTAVPEIPWATEDEATRALWIVLRPGCLIALFLAGWACDVTVFTRFRVDYGYVLGIKTDELVHPRNLLYVSVALLSFLYTTASSFGPSPTLIEGVLLGYAIALIALFVWLPKHVARQVRWREPFGRALWRCIWPDDSKEVPFVEVLVADGLTSISKAFFDIALGSCIAVRSHTSWSGDFAISSIWSGYELTENTGVKPPRSLLGDSLEECSRSVFPFIALACPFIIRARQCIITSRHRPDKLSRNLDYVNLAKYMSALPVIIFAFCHERYDGRNMLIGNSDFEALWAFAAVVNATFSFMWDLTMDWGLLNPGPVRSVHFGLRPSLVYREIFGFYHGAVILNSLGRTLWSLRWSPGASLFVGSFALSCSQQVAEVCRRCLWNTLRVEWECIRKGVIQCDKPFMV